MTPAQRKVWKELVKNANSFLNQTFDKNSAAILAADAELTRLRKAVRDLNALIISAQETMTAYLVPDGIDADQAIERVIELLDGPRQREVQKAAYAALKEAT